jgi:hypothetical protein
VPRQPARSACADTSPAIDRMAGIARLSVVRLTLMLLGLAIVAATAAESAGARTHPSPVAQHVAAWAFDDGCNGGARAAPSLVRRWLTFAESNCGPHARKASIDCHPKRRSYCKVMQYLDTNWAFKTDPDHSTMAREDSVANWWLHTPATQPFEPIASISGGYLMDQATLAVQAFFRAEVRGSYNSADGLLMDWQSPSLAQELYYSSCGCLRTREITSDAALRAAHQAMAAALTRRDGTRFIQANNSLAANPYLPQGMGMLNPAIGVDAWVAEGEPVNDGKLDAFYSTLLDQIAYITNRTSGFVVLMSRENAGSAHELQSRRVQEATVLLGFNSGRVVDWADLEQGSPSLAVWPEEGIYPTHPIQSLAAPRGRGCLAGTGVVCSRGGHNSVQVAPGVYRRVFRQCFNRGRRFGACAVIVNTTGAPVVVRSRWLRGVSLHHQITLVGGDVQSGGRVNLKGLPFHAGSTTVAPDDALLLAG